ncbi:hypothetical protein JK386_13070 [Nocardioides sp. zg-536]|uniref:Uncharacterized protein n=1 Tax=Nocardioides faecalis TaxID=2803858 RepID=A0A938Y7R6_9ACTN|nr:DUF6629 family protein [Nocardioides faecalis]MBM9460835.1 hypothetical protein [Nocardioides faecalis]MBS4752773.1 hypothetical protein [Nocardioides faecalis]QVI58023.1 hypothetical protein KG111_13445 [Nocardioides faecalis]
MCFSVAADVTAGVVLLPVAAVSLREVRTLRELPFASLPLLFALHQLTEALVWDSASDIVSPGVQHAAAMAYVLFAFPVLPILVPLAVLLLEPKGRRRRVSPFVVLGGVVAAYLLWAVLSGPLVVREEPHALVYDVGLTYGPMWAVLYVVAVIGPSVLSGYTSIVAFGLVNLVGLTVVAVVYTQAFASLWCVWAALTSVLVTTHMVLRRRLPDLHRLEGRAPEPA